MDVFRLLSLLLSLLLFVCFFVGMLDLWVKKVCNIRGRMIASVSYVVNLLIVNLFPHAQSDTIVAKNPFSITNQIAKTKKNLRRKEKKSTMLIVKLKVDKTGLYVV